jgi:hypothetical protein
MYAMIRSYPDPACTRDDLVRAGRACASVLDDAPGFISCLILRGNSGRLTVLTLFDDRAALQTAEQTPGTTLADHLADLIRPSDCVAADVIFQRGL